MLISGLATIGPSRVNAPSKQQLWRNRGECPQALRLFLCVAALRVRVVPIQPFERMKAAIGAARTERRIAMQHIAALETRSISELNFMMRDAHDRLYAARTGSHEHRLAKAAIDMISLSLLQRLN